MLLAPFIVGGPHLTGRSTGNASPPSYRWLHHAHAHTHARTHTPAGLARNHILWGSLVVHYHSTSKSMVSRNRLRHPKAGVVPRCWFGGSALDDHVDFVARSSLSSIRRKTREKRVCDQPSFSWVFPQGCHKPGHNMCFCDFWGGDDKKMKGVLFFR